MNTDDLRREYRQSSLRRADLNGDPFLQFHRWFEETVNAGIFEPNAMVLATATREGRPSCRTVLMKNFDENGVVFFTNGQSRKALEMTANPQAAGHFLWKELERQVTVEGRVEKTSAEEARAYFAKRPRQSQLGAWASQQDAVIESREVLENALKHYEKAYAGKDVPLPPYWGGFRIKPLIFEFWQGRDSRLHDRFRYSLRDGVWEIDRLSP